MKIRDLEKAEYLPTHLSSRKASGYDSWEMDRDNKTWHILDKVCESMVGQPYDVVYSKLIQKVKSMHLSKHSYLVAMDNIKWFFEHRYARYIIDDDGNVQANFSRARNKSRDVVIAEEKTIGYRLTEPTEPITWELHNELIHIIGYDRYKSIRVGYVLPDVFVKLRGQFLGNYRYDGLFSKMAKQNHTAHYRNRNFYLCNDVDWWNHCWCEVYDKDSKVVFKYRSPEYYRYRYEERDSSHKANRRMKLEREMHVEKMLYEAQLRKKELEEENRNNILRHGFDLKTSFRK